MFRKFLSYYKPHRKLLGFVLGMVVLFSLIELSIPVFTRTILNEYIPNQDIDGVLRLSAVMVVLILLFAGLHYLVGYYGHMLGVSIENDMRITAFEKLQELSFDYYDNNKAGVIMSRLTSDLHEVAELAHHGIEEILAVSLMSIVGYIYLIQLDFWVTTLLFIIFLTLIMFLLFSRRNMIISFRKLRHEHGEINSRLESSLSGIRLTRAFANEPFEIERFTDDNERYIEAYQGAYRALANSNASNNFFIQFINIAVLVAGSFLVLNGRFSTGDMFAYFLYFSLLTGPIKRLMTMLEQFQQGWAGFERYQALMDEPIKISNRSDTKVLQEVNGDISFKNVTFSYGNKKQDILHDFNLEIPAGKMVALVGPSGVGKTTIAQLIPRFYDINSGAIMIDGEDIRNYELRSLRKNIGYIQQDITIFWGSIADNIRYGKPTAAQDEIEAAAKSAGIHDFIQSLPHGYDTMVGERGVMLSGGQKQRISISRIFLKDPKILILDEATSALDNITEAYIQASLEKLAVGRTVLVVAHRLSTVQRADQIIVMGKEGISQQGTHQELIDQEGHYRNLYEASDNNIIVDAFEF